MDGFNERLRDLRRSKNITQAELAKQLGVEPSAVGKYENSQPAFPRVEVLTKMADYFEVSIDYLIKGVAPTTGIENVINGSVSNSRFIQGNNGDVTLDGQRSLSPEAVELLRIFETVSVKQRLRILNLAVEMEEEQK